VRDSTGVITSKLLAEKANPQADVVSGLARRAWRVRNEGMLQPYAPKGLDKISPQYRDRRTRRDGSAWTCTGATICFNTVEARSRTCRSPRRGRT
jgi:iron(III) transport system substrate-binding protein